jgi:hypothetical protein
VLSPIVTAVYCWRSSANEQRLWVVGVKQDGPHYHIVVWKRETLPMFAAIEAAIGTVLRPNIDSVRSGGMNRDGTDLDLFRKSVAQHVPVVFSHAGSIQAAWLPTMTSATKRCGSSIHIL